MTEGESRMDILLIQNQQSTLRSVHSALASNKTRCTLMSCMIGQQTLSYLRRHGKYAEAPIPDLILFDLTDAAAESIAIVKSIKADEHCRSLPLVLLTSEHSEDALDKLVRKCGKDAAFSPIDLNSFVRALNSFKPERFAHAVTLLEKFAYVLVRMPDIHNEIRPLKQKRLAS